MDSVTEAIGWTPLVALDRLTEGLDGRIVAKLEMLNPGFSNSYRAALRIIDEAERRGDIQAGDTVVDLTSGSPENSGRDASSRSAQTVATADGPTRIPSSFAGLCTVSHAFLDGE